MIAGARLHAGGTLNPRRHVYIERPEDSRLLELLLEGEYVNVLTSRQMGKSSLMMHTAQVLHERGVRFVTIDLASELGSPESAEVYYLGLLGKIARELKLPVDIAAWWGEHGTETVNQRLLRFFREVVGEHIADPVVVFLDEIDSTLKLPYTDDLFTALRGMYNERGLVEAYQRITFCLLGVATPNELIKDRRTTAYNVGETLELRDFDPERDDLQPLARALAEDETVGRRMLDRVLHWTGGHPFLTDRICVDLHSQAAATPEDVDRYNEATFTKLDRLSNEVHFQQILRFVETRLTDGLASLDLYARVLKGTREKDQATLAHAELKLSGLVKRNDGGVLVVRNLLYRRLFDTAWVDGTRPKRTVARTRRYAIAASIALLLTIGGGVAYQMLVVAPEVTQLTEELSVRGTFKDCTECPEIVVVPAGSFTMGSPVGEGNSDEHPQHTVTIPKPFAVSKYEITRGEYARFVESTGYAEAPGCRVRTGSKWEEDPSKSWRDPGFEQTDNHPAVCVSWQDARAYTEWLSRKTRRDYRLLTEAEWEYVTRAGTTTRYWWGDDIGRNNANCSICGSQWDGSGTAPVGSFRANGFGLYDVHGNAYEWVADCYEEDAYKTHMDYPATVGNWQDSCERVIRGGSSIYYPRLLRSAIRDRNGPDYRNDYLGFRVARSL